MKALMVVALASLFTLTGCNTVKGLGQDVSKAGQEVSEGAEKIQNKL